ncbi:MAG: hypothetical protein M3546_15205 [Actinomycetota bacterium]|nr:hypothetical protein [Actinomycetota bacterium]
MALEEDIGEIRERQVATCGRASAQFRLDDVAVVVERFGLRRKRAA